MDRTTLTNSFFPFPASFRYILQELGHSDKLKNVRESQRIWRDFIDVIVSVARQQCSGRSL